MPFFVGAKVWWLAGLIGLLPFLLGIRLDLVAVERESYQELYERWKWSEAGQNLRTHSVVRYEQKEGDPGSQFFGFYLAKDFQVDPARSDVPLVRSFHVGGERSSVRVDVVFPSSTQPEVGAEVRTDTWVGHERRLNNGIWLGPWIGMVALVLGAGLSMAVRLSMFGIFLWWTRWDFIEIPVALWLRFSSFFSELSARVSDWNWDLLRPTAVIWVGLLFWVVFRFLAQSRIGRFGRSIEYRGLGQVLGMIFVLELGMLWVGSHLAGWGGDAKWWYVYLGSWVFRFSSVGVLFFLFYERYVVSRYVNSSPSQFRLQEQPGLLPLGVAVAFLLSSGFQWAETALNVGETLGNLLRLKAFLVSLLVSVAVGSRVMGTIVIVVLYTFTLPPTEGHWKAAAYFGALMDGLWMGWFLSPFKGTLQWIPYFSRVSHFIFVSVVGWMLGTLLTSLGIPLWVSWPMYILVLWSYQQLRMAWQEPAVGSS